MLRPADIVIDAFVGFLRDTHAQTFADADPLHARAVERAARLALPRIASTDALFHDLDHALCVVQVGQDMLRGRIIRDGDVRSKDWAHMVAALLCVGVGFCQGAVVGDRGRVRVIDEHGGTVTLAEGATDGALWRYHIERAALFVRERFRDDRILDADRLEGHVRACRLIGQDNRPDGLDGLVRDAQLIGILGSPRLRRRLTPFFLEVQEAGLLDAIGTLDRGQFHQEFAHLFWKTFHPSMREGMELLQFTGAGREWLANLRAHVLRREHGVPEK